MNSIDWSYFEKFQDIIDKYMPSTGEGNNAASQAVTAVNKLIYKWYNDGDVYDNTYNLEGWMNDLSSYANWLDKYTEAGPILDRISRVDTEAGYEKLLADLANQILNDRTLAKLLAKYGDSAVGSIYNCEGPFSYLNPDDWDENGDYTWENDEDDFWDEDEYGDREEWDYD